MDREQSWQVITEQRLGLARLLERLSDTDWEHPSLCAGWRVRDVAAHVAMAPQAPGLAAMLAEGIRARGNFHRLTTMPRYATPPGPRPTSWPSCARTRTLVGCRRSRTTATSSSTSSSTLRTLPSRWAGTTRCRPRLLGLVPPECGPWDGRSGPAIGSAECGCSPLTPPGSRVPASSCGARSGCAAAVDRAYRCGPAAPVGPGLVIVTERSGRCRGPTSTTADQKRPVRPTTAASRHARREVADVRSKITGAGTRRDVRRDAR